MVEDRKKVASLVRMLGSDHEGERLNALRMLGRALQSQSRNFNDLGDDIETGGNGGALNKSEAEQIYNAGHKAGYDKGAHDAGLNRIFNLNGDDGFGPVNGSVSGPKWREKAQFVGSKVGFLHRDRDREFAQSIAEQANWKSYISQAQEKWLDDLYVRLGGKS
jgi:hypothetical protein